MKQVQRLFEPLAISAGTATTFIATFGANLSHLQSIVAISVGMVTLVYTVLKCIQIFGQLKDAKTSRAKKQRRKTT